MPIKPENAARYPKDWKQIRLRILERAGHKCEQCGVPNHWYRLPTGQWIKDGDEAISICALTKRPTYIVLTVAHLDHTPENCADENLRAWCQKCHLAYDHEHHMKNARETRRKGKAVAELFA